MPNPIIAAAQAFATWAASLAPAALAPTVYAVAYATAYVGGSALVSVGLSAVARSQIPDPEAGKIPRRQPRPVRSYAVGGMSRMSGPYMLRETKGNKLALVIALNDARLDSIDRYYLHDDRVTLSGGFVQGLSPEKYGSGDLVKIDKRLGLATETAYSFLTTEFPAEWPSTSRGDGIASLGILAQHRSRESFPRHYPNGEIMPSVAATPVCYDWREDSTAGGSGSQRRNTESTWGPCWNPVVWLVHVEWARHGRSWDRCIEPVLDELTAEADYCDELVAKAGGGTEARYRLAGNYPVNTTPEAVRTTILSTFDGWMSVDGQGRLIIKAGRYVEPTFTLTGAHIEGYSWRAFQTDEECCNQLHVSYVSADHEFTQVDAGIWEDAADISARGKEWSEDLALTWVPSASQSMRLAGRKGRRINAERRGSVRTGIYGLNGLGQRYIRVQNPELSSMADVVVEVMDVEIDFERAQVTFEVILADTTPDDDEVAPDVDTPDPVTPVTPVLPTSDPAVRPVTRDEVFPTAATEDTVTLLSMNAVLPDGKQVAITGDTITGLAASTTYGVFWREDEGVEVEVYPALTRMGSGSWVFLGWQSTEDGAGNFPTPPVPPGGYGGSDAADAFGSSAEALAGTLGDLAVLDSVDLATAQVIGKSLANLDGAANTKLTGIQAGAQVNPADLAALDGAAATKLAGIQAGAQVNPANLAALDSAAATKLAGIETGATDDSTVTALSADLLSGAVKPAEAVTFTGKGDLAEKNTAATADLDANAATKPARYDSAAEIDWVAAGIATGPITSRATVFNTSIITTGAEVQVTASFFLRLQHSQDDVVLYVVVERSSTGGGGTVDVFLATTQSLAVSGDGFICWSQPINFTDTPPAGTVSYFVRVYHTYSIGSPGGFVTWKHRNRTMGFLETKR